MKNSKLEKALTEQAPEPPAEKWIRTGCDLLDILLGGKKGAFGIRAGDILGIWGDSGSGKSSVINEMIAANYYRDPEHFKWVDSDGENGNKFDSVKLYGIEISSEGKEISGFAKGDKGKMKPVTITFRPSTTVQEMSAHTALFLSGLKEGEYAIYAQDSLDSITDAGAEDELQERVSKLVSDKEVVDKGSYNMGKQKSLSGFFSSQCHLFKEKNCLLILTSQYRAKIGSLVPNQKTVTGGYALKYYCDTILDLTTVNKIEAAGRWIGSVVKARTKNKSRTERPGREIYYTVFFTQGIDNVGSNIDYLYDLRNNEGKLVSDEVYWGSGKVPNLDNVEEWLKSSGRMDSYKDFAYKVVGKRKVNLDVVEQWAMSGVPENGIPPVCPDEYSKEFGKKMTRDELRNLCQEDPEARKTLRQMVIDKWETEEQKATDAVGFKKVFDNFD